MSKLRGFFPILIPSVTVFLSSGCIMILELVAGRLIARHLGSSLYTWTSVIGVVLAGITIGNYIGGRIADRYEARKALAVLFGISSAACVITVVMNNLVGEWELLRYFNWPIRVFSHVALVFLMPSTLLGTISPVVAKMALDRGLPTGRTVGDIYAWGAAGSIAGTFLAGFYLIAAMGTIAIIWTVGAALLVMAILYWARLWVLYLWAAVFIALMAMGMAPSDWAKSAGSSFALRERHDPEVIYEDESQYCYIAVKRVSENPDRRLFLQDKLMHSEIVMGDINNLGYSYEQIYAAVTHQLSVGKDKLSILAIGGGGYVFPRYVEKVWSGSHIDVVEIDPGVTEAAMQAFGLARDTTIKTHSMDGRNYVTQLLEQKQPESQRIHYDFIYEDALNDFSVPYQLTTKEFNDQIYRLLADDGAYMIELIDTYDSGLFVGSFVNTLEKTFPHVYVVTTEEPSTSIRNTFVVIAAKHEINFGKTGFEGPIKNLNLWILNNSEIATLKKKAEGTVLTDDYAPVENLLAPVVSERNIGLLTGKRLAQAQKLKEEGKFDKSIAKYEEVIKLNPAMSLLAYNEIAMIRKQQGDRQKAVQLFRKAIDYNERSRAKVNIASIHYNLGLMLKELKQFEEATEYLRKAIDGFKEELAKNPNSAETLVRLGNALAETGDFKQATGYFQQAVNITPHNMQNHFTLAKALEIQGRYDEAIAALKKAAVFMSESGQEENAANLQKYIQTLETQKSKANK